MAGLASAMWAMSLMYDNAARTMQKADAYTLASLRVGRLRDDWDIYVFARNLTDEKYINPFESSPATGGIARSGDPRAIGAGVSYSF